MNKQNLNISLDDYWSLTLKSVESTLGLLCLVEGQNQPLVDKVITSLRELVEQGKEGILTKPKTSPTQPYLTKEKNRMINPTQENNMTSWSRTVTESYKADIEPHWKYINSNTIEIKIEKDKTVSCIAVNTEEGLDQVIQDVYLAPYVAVDCEMMGSKKNLPELKLLQIGVSDRKGYAIQVDLIDYEILSQRLKPVLEDSNLNIVGWSYRFDGLAIENFFKQIQQAPVLDLQAKLKPIAVEDLSLAKAMDQFAKEWDGIEEFRTVKKFSESFNYTDTHCVWLKHPLPPKALVYSVFDVLSVHALYQSTKNYEQAEKFYWPFTITNGANSKAITNWQRQRQKAQSTTPPVKSKTMFQKNHYNQQRKERYTTPIPMPLEPETQDGYDDNDEKHQLEIQKAIAISLKENYPKERLKEDRVVGELDETIQEIHYQDLPTLSSTVEVTSWGESNLDIAPFIGEQFNKARSSPRTDDTRIKSPKPDDNRPRPSRPTRRNLNPTRKPSPQIIPKEPFRNKPSKEKYPNEIQSGYHPTGSFTWSEPASASWKSFAESTNENWKRGHDTEIEDLELSEKTKMISKSDKTKSFDNRTIDERSDKVKTFDNWMIDEKPDTMEIPLNNLPVPKTFNGPRVLYPDDFDDEEDSEDEKKSKQFGIKMVGIKMNKAKKEEEEESEIFRDELYLYGEYKFKGVSMLILEKLDHLNWIRLPKDQSPIYLTYHYAELKGFQVLKAIQLFMETGESYTCVIEKACQFINQPKLRSTILGKILTDPTVRRVCWYPEHVQSEFKRTLGFVLGPSVDLSQKINHNHEKPISFKDSISRYLNGWKDRDQYFELKDEYDSSLSSKKFSGTSWDRDRLSDTAVKYSAVQGLALYSLYQHSLTMGLYDKDYIWENDS